MSLWCAVVVVVGERHLNKLNCPSTLPSLQGLHRFDFPKVSVSISSICVSIAKSLQVPSTCSS